MSVHGGPMGKGLWAACCYRPAPGLVGLTTLVGGIVCFVTLGMPCSAQAAGGDGGPDVQVQRTADPAGARDYQALARQGDWGTIDALARAALASKATDLTSLYWLGTAQFQTENTVGALKTLRTAQAGGLDSSQIHLALGQVYYKLNQFVLFEQQMEQASHLDPQDGTAPYLLGFYQLSIRSDVAGALALLRRAAALRPDDAKALYELGYCLELSGATAEAKKVYLQATALAPGSRHPFAWPYQGLARLELDQDRQQAVQFAAEAVRLEPGEASNHLVLAKSYERVNEIPEAVSEAREAANRNPSSASTRYLLFRLYRRRGEFAQADEELKAYHEIEAVYGPE